MVLQVHINLHYSAGFSFISVCFVLCVAADVIVKSKFGTSVLYKYVLRSSRNIKLTHLDTQSPVFIIGSIGPLGR